MDSQASVLLDMGAGVLVVDVDMHRERQRWSAVRGQ